VPPWKRDQIPLLYINGKLAQVLLGTTAYTAKQFVANADVLTVQDDNLIRIHFQTGLPNVTFSLAPEKRLSQLQRSVFLSSRGAKCL